MYSKWLQVLVKCPLFEGMDMDQLNSMLECIKPRVLKYNKDEFIALAGNDFKGVGIILSGEAIIVKENVAGNRVIISMIESGEIFGEMAAFSGKPKWPASVIAQQPCNVIFISSKTFVSQCENLCVSHQLLIMNMLKILSQKALILNRKMEYLSIRSIRGKIIHYLLEQYKQNDKNMFTLPLNRNELADFLNIPRPSLSREMCRMRDEGLIDFYRSSIRINSLENLKALADL
ncbi:MAG: Crp/Fnr family transcriptional regulator [Clostridiales bacterium]|nr:Crp/Fnr family transcriptional regulator [Clostridiales bacterium]